ncbi:MAG TPA: ATP-dependent DNA ligase [Acidimicrobiales bacterium]|nr:ATP-dependent DNA ligase [Acidimicrobiales bacterium]
MQLPVMPPVAPMLAKLSRQMPEGGGLVYEPKWDGFRCIVFRDGPEIELGSRNERPLTRYFPELVESLLANLPERCVIDGEIVIAGPSGLDFDALLQRIHPAESRVRLLASTTPSSFVAFDLLAIGDEDLRGQAFDARRTALERALGAAKPPVYLTPATSDPVVARDWFERFEGAGLDGVVAKPVELAYREGERVMLKVKHERTADCVVGGFRQHKDGGGVGSLLLGLYDEDRALHHVGVASGFAVVLRKSLVDDLAPYRSGDFEGHPWRAMISEADSTRRPGTPSRWNANKDLSWEPVSPELVCEVGYDHLQGDRFRHATSFRRWRPDRKPESCTYAQLEVAVPEELARVFGAGR